MVTPVSLGHKVGICHSLLCHPAVEHTHRRMSLQRPRTNNLSLVYLKNSAVSPVYRVCDGTAPHCECSLGALPRTGPVRGSIRHRACVGDSETWVTILALKLTSLLLWANCVAFRCLCFTFGKHLIISQRAGLKFKSASVGSPDS